jgi:ClpP class serine protease
MKSRLEKVLDKMPNKKVDLKAQKVALGLIDQLGYSYDEIEDQGGLLSYLAYEWHQEKFEEYRQAWMTLNDEYKHNASAVLRFDDVSSDIDTLNEIAVRAEELGIDPSDVYDRFYDHLERLNEMREADSDYQRNEMEFRDWS